MWKGATRLIGLCALATVIAFGLVVLANRSRIRCALSGVRQCCDMTGG